MGVELFHVDGRTEGRTDGYDEADTRFSQFCERAKESDEKWSGSGGLV